MDDSSRNILKFIAAGTSAILLLMAAYFYGLAPQPKPMPSPPAEVTTPAEPIAESQIGVTQDAEDEVYSDEEAKPIDGQPTDPAMVDE